MTPVLRRDRPSAETKRRKKMKEKSNSLTCAKEKEKAKIPNPIMNLSKALPTIDKEDQKMRKILKVLTWSTAKEREKAGEAKIRGRLKAATCNRERRSKILLESSTKCSLNKTARQ